VCTGLHAALLAAAGWLYFGGGLGTAAGWFGMERSHGDLPRRVVLFSFGVVLFARMGLGLFWLLKRKFAWNELGGVLMAVFVYQIVFALLGGSCQAPIDIADVLAVALFVVGSFLNTGSEVQRKRFKDRPENQGRLYTAGLFRYARHINYFGDTLWVTAWAIVTGNAWSAIIPAALAAAFVFAFIPSLTRHLQARYGDQYDQWAKTTKAFVPFVY